MTAIVSVPVVQMVSQQKLTVPERRDSVKLRAFQDRLAVVRPLRAPSDAAIFTAEQKICCTRRGVRCDPPVTVILHLSSTNTTGSHQLPGTDSTGAEPMGGCMLNEFCRKFLKIFSSITYCCDSIGLTGIVYTIKLRLYCLYRYEIYNIK